MVLFEKMKNSPLRTFLESKVKEVLPGIFEDEHDELDIPLVAYTESTSPDAIDGDKWLKNHQPYIWKIGVLTLVDSNKRDWAYAFIGHHREPDHPMEFIGMLHWQDGENDDIARSIERYVECLEACDIVFRVDRW